MISEVEGKGTLALRNIPNASLRRDTTNRVAYRLSTGTEYITMYFYVLRTVLIPNSAGYWSPGMISAMEGKGTLALRNIPNATLRRDTTNRVSVSSRLFTRTEPSEENRSFLQFALPTIHGRC